MELTTECYLVMKVLLQNYRLLVNYVPGLSVLSVAFEALRHWIQWSVLMHLAMYLWVTIQLCGLYLQTSVCFSLYPCKNKTEHSSSILSILTNTREIHRSKFVRGTKCCNRYPIKLSVQGFRAITFSSIIRT